MPSTTIYNMNGEAVDSLELSDRVFGVKPNVAVLHQVVTAQLVNRRQGNASTKKRNEVSGGNKKPYRQKGTGRARQGSTRSPQFRHGGVVFGPRPHGYHHDVPKKMRRLAIRSALSDKVANEKLIVLKDLFLEAPRTKDMLALLERLPLGGPSDKGRKVLMMLPQRDENVVLSTRNISTAKVQHVCSINVIELLKHDCLIVPVQTVRWLELVFGEGKSAEEASAIVASEVGVVASISRNAYPSEDVGDAVHESSTIAPSDEAEAHSTPTNEDSGEQASIVEQAEGSTAPDTSGKDE